MNGDSFKGEVQGFNGAIACILDHYTTEKMSQAERLIGYAVVLFTILGTRIGQFEESFPNLLEQFARSAEVPFAILITKMAKLFPSLSEVIVRPFPQPNVLELMKFLVLFLIVSFLMAFIFRSVFRFTFFSKYTDDLKLVTEADVDYRIREDMTLHQAIDACVVGKFKKSTLYFFGIPVEWFLTEKKWNGWGLCIILGLVSTSLIMFALW